MNATARATTAYKRIKLWKHFAFIWAPALIVFPLLVLIALAIGGLGFYDAASGAVLTFLVVLFTGWFPPLVIWLLRKGFRGWALFGNQVRDAGTWEARNPEGGHYGAPEDYAPITHHEDTPEGTAVPDEPLPAEPLTDEQMMAHWREMNTYPCCQDHRDAEGYPSHGGPGCVHPEITAQA